MPHAGKYDGGLIDWLMAGDPAIRWQVRQDLLDEDAEAVMAERRRIALEGWGRRLLDHQDPDGRWAGQLYNRKWVSTAYTLLLLEETGIVPNENTTRGCGQLFQNGIYHDEDIRFSGKKLRDLGVTGLALGIFSYFAYPDSRVHVIARFLARNQRSDGSWHYDERAGAGEYAFEVTLAVLKGLLAYQTAYPGEAEDVAGTQRRGREFLLEHKLFRDTAADGVIKQDWLRFSFPCYWFYDILAALDYFRLADTRDERLQEAVGIVRERRDKDGTWPLQNRHAGETFFEMERAGEPSRWNTLRCLRAIRWWETPGS